MFFPEKASHPTTHPRRHNIGTLPIFFNSSNFSFFVNSLHQHRSSHIYLHLNILLPLSLEPATRRSISSVLAPLNVSVREPRCGSESKELELQQSIIPELGHQTKANVEAEGSERRSVSFICRPSAQTLNFSKGASHCLSIAQDTKTCDNKKAVALTACAYLAGTEAPFAPPAQKSDVWKRASSL